MGEMLLKTGEVPQELRDIISYLLGCNLEKKLAFIREQELESDDSEDLDETVVSVESGDAIKRFNAAISTVDITEDPESPKKKYNKYAPKEIATDDDNGKGFAGTPLKLFPNVRETEMDLGKKSSWFTLFGIERRIGTVVKMYQGPNRRVNRYLTFQYTRLFKSIGGSLVSTKC